MTNAPLTTKPGLTPQQYARLMDQAKAEARRLRRQAIDSTLDRLIDAARAAIGGHRRAVPARPTLSACAPSRSPTRRPPSCRQTTALPSA
jgi:hypothetical protein